jgi:peptidyl-tRNA hydrolase
MKVASGSITVAAIGPAPSSEIDLLTKQYKLL